MLEELDFGYGYKATVPKFEEKILKLIIYNNISKF